MKRLSIRVLCASFVCVFVGSFSAHASEKEAQEAPFLQASCYFTNLYEQTKDNVTVEVTRLSADESKKYLGADYKALGYTPLLLAINNNSGDQLLLRGSAIQLPLQARHDMAHAAHYDTFMWTTFSGYAAFLYCWPIIIPVAIGGSYMAWNNSTVSKRVYALGLEYADALEILPYDRIEKILFVRDTQPTDYFFMYLYNVHQKEFIPFAVSFMQLQYDNPEFQELQKVLN